MKDKSKNNVTALHPAPASRDVRAQVLALMQAHAELTQAEISRQSGLNGGKISQYLRMTGAYGNSADVEAELAKWLDAWHERQRHERGLPAAPAWIDMPSSRRMLEALTYAQMSAGIVVVYGTSGVGKSQTCKHYATTNPNVWVATMSPATKTSVPALEEVALALGIKPIGGAARIQRSIVEHTRRSRGLLVIDEAGNLGIEALDTMRTIQEAAGIGLALVGNEIVFSRMTGGDRAAYLARLYARIGKRVYLRAATHGDIDAVMAAWKLTDNACIEVARDIASKPGGLHMLTMTLRLASLFAIGDKRKTPTLDDVRAAWRDLVSES